MLIHASKRWPGVVTIHLSPYAMRMANQAYNATPLTSHTDKQSPNKIFDNSVVDIKQNHWKPFGCPTYVLKSELQGTMGIHPKWDARSRAGIYLQQSPIHNRNVALVLNIHTGYVSPQFHVKFDETFQTILQEKWNATWLTSTGFTKQINRVSQDEDTKTPGKHRKTMERQPVPNGEIRDHPGKRQMVAVTANGPTRHQMSLAPERQVPANLVSHIPCATVADKHPVASEKPPESNVTPLTTRSGRLVKPVPRLINLMMSEFISTTKRQIDIEGELLSFAAMTHKSVEECNPILAYRAVNPNILRLHEAMKAKDQKEFKTAMEKEVNDQIENGNFSVIPRSKVPKDFHVFPGVWMLVCKRDILTREIKKYKARLAFNGSRMREGEDYDKTYAPVASWMSIQLLLTFVVAFGWHTQQVDYVAAYTQAPIDRDMYMEFPRGFKVPGGVDRKAFVLKLHHNLYGQKQAGHVWYKYLCKRLITKAGFVQSKHDECLFFRGKAMYALYIDDSILGAPTHQELDEAIKAIKDAKLQITLEGDLADFLGVKIERKSPKEIIFTQPHLIDDILNDLWLKHAKDGKETPAALSRILTRNDNGTDHNKSFHYRSVIGKLNYLEKATRPDISFATHQCAHFVADPKKSQARAVRWLGRYLLLQKGKAFDSGQISHLA